MIDIRKLKELVRLMVANELTELDLRDSQEQVTLRRNGHMNGSDLGTISPPVSAKAAASPAAPGLPTPITETAAATSTAAHALDDSTLHRIESPMVGTFYSGPNPDAPPFVEIGASIGENTVICLVEAMKIFNEIKAECTGTIEQVLVKNGEAVEFGQPLFLVRTG